MAEFLAAVLVFGGLWFWVVATVVFFLVMAFAENDSPIKAFVVLAIFMLMLNYAGTTDTWALIKESPWIVVKWLVYYFAAGAIWSTVKWTLFARKLAEEYRDWRNKFLAKSGVDGSKIPDDLQEDFNAFMNSSTYSVSNSVNGYGNTKFDPRPEARRYADKFTHWIIWWPTSFLWTLFDDFFVKIAKVIRELFQGVYSRITNLMFRDLVD